MVNAGTAVEIEPGLPANFHFIYFIIQRLFVIKKNNFKNMIELYLKISLLFTTLDLQFKELIERIKKCLLHLTIFIKYIYYISIYNSQFKKPKNI